MGEDEADEAVAEMFKNLIDKVWAVGCNNVMSFKSYIIAKSSYNKIIIYHHYIIFNYILL